MIIFVGHSYQNYTAPERYIPHYRSLEREYPVSFCFAHDELGGEHLLGDIRSLVSNAAACIFDFTGQSRNVMIEYGMAVALGKPHMLLLRMGDADPVPAMLEGLRYQEYWFASRLQEHLRGFLETQVNHNAVSDSQNLKRKAIAFIRENTGVTRQQLYEALAIDTHLAGGVLESLLDDQVISMLPNTRQYIANP